PGGPAERERDLDDDPGRVHRRSDSDTRRDLGSAQAHLPLTRSGAPLHASGAPGSEALEELPHVAFEGLAVDVAHHAPDHLAAAIDEEGGGDGADRAVEIEHPLVRHCHAELETEPVDEVAYDLGLGVVHGDADHDEALAREASLHFVEVGEARAARAAPRGPEVEHDDLAPEIGGLHGATIEATDGEGGSGRGVAAGESG